jgi:hypothetical protein
MAEEEILDVTGRKFRRWRVDMTYTSGQNSADLARSNPAPFLQVGVWIHTYPNGTLALFHGT